MGIDCSVRCFYGVIFKYDELSKINIENQEELRSVANDIGCEFPDELSNIWQEISSDCYCVYPYFNPIQEDIIYVYGDEYMDHEVSWGRMDGIITDFVTLEKWYDNNRDFIQKKVLDICKRYGLKYREPELLMLMSVY